MEELKRWWKGLSRRERAAVAVLAAVAAAFLLYRVFYIPKKSALGSLLNQEHKLQQSIAELQTTLAGLNEESAEWDAYAAESDLIAKEVGRLEDKVIGPDELNTLLALLSEYGNGLKLEFHTIKQRTGSASALFPNAPYKDIAIEVVFESDYAGLVNYLKRIETISPLLKVSEMTVTEAESENSALRRSQLTLTIPVLNAPNAEKSLSAQTRPLPPVVLDRSLFGDFAPKIAPEKLAAIEVTGITITSRSKSAIINGEVRREGEPVEDFTLEAILSDRVLLSDGEESYPVMLQ